MGFTLIETVLALGIVAVGLLTIMGMLPLGLDVAHKAADLTISAQIGERLGGMIQELNLSQFQTQTAAFQSLEQGYYYFDGEGQPLASGVPGTPVYSASILPAPASNTGSNPASLVGAGGTATLEIVIVNDPAHTLTGSPVPVAQLPTNLQSQAVILPFYFAYVPNGS